MTANFKFNGFFRKTNSAINFNIFPFFFYMKEKKLEQKQVAKNKQISIFFGLCGSRSKKVELIRSNKILSINDKFFGEIGGKSTRRTSTRSISCRTATAFNSLCLNIRHTSCRQNNMLEKCGQMEFNVFYL